MPIILEIVIKRQVIFQTEVITAISMYLIFMRNLPKRLSYATSD